MRISTIATVCSALSIGMAAWAQDAETETTDPLIADAPDTAVEAPVETPHAPVAEAANGAVDVLSSLPSNAIETIRLPYDAWFTHAQAGMDVLDRQALAPTSELISGTIGWFRQESASAIQAATESLGESFEEGFEALLEIPELPSRSIHEFLQKIQADETSEFAMLVNDSGFALADVTFGMKIFPELSVHFRHVRDLTPEESVALDARIDEFISDHENGVGYIEAAVLRALVRAGEYSESLDLHGVDVSILPLPGLALQVDPFGYEQTRSTMLVEAFREAELALALEQSLEGRLDDVETFLQAIANGEIVLPEPDAVPDGQ